MNDPHKFRSPPARRTSRVPQLEPATRKCLGELLEAELRGEPVEICVWRARNAKKIKMVDQLRRDGMLEGDSHYRVTFWGLMNSPSRTAKPLMTKCGRVFRSLREHYAEHPKDTLSVADLARLTDMSKAEALQCARFLSRSVIFLSVQDGDPKNVCVLPSESYVTCNGLAELKRRTSKQARSARSANFISAIGEFTAFRSLMSGLEAAESEDVRDSWRLAVERVDREPAGAITATRAMVEAACKFVLEEYGESTEGAVALPVLFRKATAVLKLDHRSEMDESLRRALQAGATLVDSLAQLRNSLGDAHGKGRLSPRPARRHAELAILIAAGIASFLLASLDAKRL